MARNRFKVPLKQWRKWTPGAQGAFNAVFSSMVNNQWGYLHPKQEPIRREYWRTTCWNAAWAAANAAQDGCKTVPVK